MPLSAFPMTNGTIANTSLDALVLSRLLLVELFLPQEFFLGKACVWQAGDLAPAKRNNDSLFNLAQHGSDRLAKRRLIGGV